MSSSKSEVSQPIWESSQRLLHPKCVWIGSMRGISNGAYRHFIFDQNLTPAYRTRCDSMSFSSHINHNTRMEKSQSCDTVESEMDGLSIGLSIVGAGERIQNTRSLNSLNDHSELIADISFEHEFYDSLESPANAGTMGPIDNSDEKAIAAGMKRISSEIDSSKNLLAERVLQWLDLAGGRDSLSTRQNDHHAKALNATKRRSFTAKEHRKNASEPDDSVELKPKLRREPLHQMSMTFDDVLNGKESTTSPNFFSNLFPTTYKYSRKFLTMRRPKNAIDSLEPLDLQTSLPIKSTIRKSHRSKPKRNLEYCDDQYRSLIQRDILETSCNTQAAKRQLHIFMPNIPKRCLIVNDCDVNSTMTAATKATTQMQSGR